jgi:hypothetical protein
MTFLRKYGFSAVGLNYFTSALAMVEGAQGTRARAGMEMERGRGTSAWRACTHSRRPSFPKAAHAAAAAQLRAPPTHPPHAPPPPQPSSFSGPYTIIGTSARPPSPSTCRSSSRPPSAPPRR